MSILAIAIDWSGAKQGGGRNDIAIAECDRDGLRLVPGRYSREGVCDWLIEKKAMLEAANGVAEMVVGIDFAFSLPAWFVSETLQAGDVASVRQTVAADGEDWLRGRAPWPFWGVGEQPGSTRHEDEKAYRETERDMWAITTTRPKSVFQLVGAGQVGPGWLRGMPILQALRQEGFAIWPFDDVSLPLIVEIYPRVLTGPVRKNKLDARRAYLADHGMRDPAAGRGSSGNGTCV